MITSGCHAIVQKLGGEHIRVCELGRKRMILIEKLRFNADGALNQPFGLFEVSAGKLSRVYEDVSNVEQTSITDLEKDTDAVRTEPSSLETATIPAACSSSEENGQNAANNHDQDVRNSDELNADDPSPIDRVSDIQSQESEPLDGEPVDTRNPAQSRQKLTQEEISLMKNTGISTDELVAKLVDGNVAFSERTSYAKSKYIRRKAKKHSDRVLILKPNIRLIAESYYKKDPDRISNLRLDMLSQILLLSGLRSGSRCLVFEQCLGLLTAAIIERLGGEGACVHIHRGLIAQAIPCVQSMDFDEQTYSTFLPLRVATLLNGKVDEDEENAESSSSNMLSEASLARRMDRLRREKIAWQLISDQQIDCLFIAVKGVDPTDVLARTWHSLRLASTIVLYSPISEPLICAYNWLKENGAVHVQVCDSFQRSYQVLPESTHPVMQQLVAAGFILSAIKVQPPQSL